MSDGIILSSPTKTRERTSLIAQGLTAETFSREHINTSTVLVDGVAYFVAIGLHAGDVVTNITVAISGAGSGVTLSKVGLYDKSGNRLGLSADQGTAWQSTGLKTIALTSAYTVPADDGYYVAIISKASVTVPSVGRSTTMAAASGAIGSGMGAFGVETGQTDLDATCTISFVGSPICFWAGIS